MANEPFRIEGLDTVLKNLSNEIKGIKGGTKKGLIEGGKLVRREGMQITPVGITGNLIGSWYGPQIFEDSKENPFAEIGLTAEYAPFVHEMVDEKFKEPVNWKKPGAQAKFLETPLKFNTKNIVDIIKKHAKR